MRFPFFTEPLWYADKPNQYSEEEYRSLELKEVMEKLNEMFRGISVHDNEAYLNLVEENETERNFLGKNDKQDGMIYCSFRLNSVDSMGHNSATEIALEVRDNIIESISIDSYDKGPSFVDGFFEDDYFNSEWICNSQIHQVVDLLNLICESNYQYPFP